MFRPALLVLPAMALVGACSTVSEIPTTRVASANLKLANGLPAGTAQLVSNGQEVTLTAALAGLSPGEHAIHLHTTGLCEAPAFTSAGGHLNPQGKQHGMDNPAGSHLGDLPNLAVGGSGAGTITVKLDGRPDDVMAELFDSDGTAVVVHAGPDDYKTDPSGNAGGRVACGILNRI